MKRFGAIFLTLCLLLPSLACAQEADEHTTTLDRSAYGVTIMRNHEVKASEKQKLAADYPTFESGDAALARFLNDSITTPILALRKLGQMAEDAAYEQGNLDAIRSGYFASLDFQDLLSVEATVSNRSADGKLAETSFLYRIVDLKNSRILSVAELFTETEEQVSAAIAEAVYNTASAQGILLEKVTGASAVPAPNSYYVDKSVFRTIYAAGTISEKAVVVDLPWDELPLTPSALLTPAGNATPEDGQPAGTVLMGDQTGDTTPVGDQSDEAATAEPDQNLFAMPDTGVQPTNANQSGSNPADTPLVEAALDPHFSLPPVATPTPMPVAGNDAIVVDVLTHGLWKQLGTEGDTYYQFTADGKLLTIEVSGYSVEDGTLISGALNGTVDIGSDSAFTLRTAEDTLQGYVLNREGEAVAPAEFVTPSPTPVPTPTPPPTIAPTPTPTIAPTPTLSPYEQARTQAPSLAALSDVSFEKRNSLRVYSAPDEEAYRDSKAQVTTDEKVSIYGTVKDWVMVGYTIGNGTKGRIGYISNSTLADAKNVAQLGLCEISMILQKDANATDDPLNGKGTITKLKKGDTVTLLAFLGSDWAYIATMYKEKPCRLFIPQAALMEE